MVSVTQIPDSVQSSHILLTYQGLQNAGAQTRTKAQAKKLADSLEGVIKSSPSKMAELAKEFSEDEGSALNGGDLDWFTKGTMVTQFEDMMLSSENNVVSEVFQTDYGYHFLEVLGTRNFDKTSELIEDRAYSALYSRKFDEELENTLRSIRAEAFVEIKTLD